MQAIMCVTNATVADVGAWLDALDNAFEAFDAWLAAQSYGYNERVAARGYFEFRFSTGSGATAARYCSAIKSVGATRAAELHDAVKSFSVGAGLCSDAGFDDSDLDD